MDVSELDAAMAALSGPKIVPQEGGTPYLVSGPLIRPKPAPPVENFVDHDYEDAEQLPDKRSLVKELTKDMGDRKHLFSELVGIFHRAIFSFSKDD